jgi:hypothetical protein
VSYIRFELLAIRMAAQVIARWRLQYGDRVARAMVVEHASGVHGDIGPVFRAAYLTGFGL